MVHMPVKAVFFGKLHAENLRALNTTWTRRKEARHTLLCIARRLVFGLHMHGEMDNVGRMLLGVGHQALNGLWHELVILVDESHVRTRRSQNARLTRTERALVVLQAQHAHAGIRLRMTLGQGRRGIATCVVHRNNLKVAVGLAAQAEQALVKVPLVVIHRHHDGDAGHNPPPTPACGRCVDALRLTFTSSSIATTSPAALQTSA